MRAVLPDHADRITAAVDDLQQVLDSGAPERGWQLRAVALAGAVAARAIELNNRPRKIHGYRTPTEIYAEILNSGDALTLRP